MFTVLLSLLLALWADALPPVVHTLAPERLIVPSLGVDAPVVTLGIKENGDMESPDGSDPVGWYTFSPTPGNPGNTVFSGHRDWHTGRAGIFGRLGELRSGDNVSVVLTDGSRVTYVVALSVLIAPDEMPIGDIIGVTPVETLTLITCEGTFDATSRDYDKRRIVWASRTP